VFYSARCELARGKGYRTDACQHGRNLEEQSLSPANSVYPLQVTSHKAGAATQLHRSLPTFALKLFLLRRSLGDLRGAVVPCGRYAKTGFQLLKPRQDIPACIRDI